MKSIIDVLDEAAKMECDILCNSWVSWILVAKSGNRTETICVFGRKKPSNDAVKFFFQQWLRIENRLLNAWEPSLDETVYIANNDAVEAMATKNVK
jgi:hypothetical protein